YRRSAVRDGRRLETQRLGHRSTRERAAPRVAISRRRGVLNVAETPNRAVSARSVIATSVLLAAAGRGCPRGTEGRRRLPAFTHVFPCHLSARWLARAVH